MPFWRRHRPGRSVDGPLALGRRTRLRDVEFAVLDTETSDWDPDHASIVQIAVVVCRGDGTILERWSSYVRPPDGHVGPTEVHGVTFDHVVRARVFEEVLADLVTRLRGRIRVAHNLPFDAQVLDRAFDRAGYHPGRVADLDTLALSVATTGSSRGHGLKSLCDRHGVALDNWHDARADAEATAHLLPCLLAERGLRRVGDLVDVAPSVAGRGDWPAPRFSSEVVARVAAEKAVPADLLWRRAERAARAQAERAAERARERARRTRFRKGTDDVWRVVGTPDAIKPGLLVVPTRRGSTVVEVVEVQAAPDEAGVAQVQATVRPVALLRPGQHDGAWEVHGPSVQVRPGPVVAVREDATTVTVEVGPTTPAGERDGLEMVRAPVVGAVSVA